METLKVRFQGEMKDLGFFSHPPALRVFCWGFPPVPRHGGRHPGGRILRDMTVGQGSVEDEDLTLFIYPARAKV